MTKLRDLQVSLVTLPLKITLRLEDKGTFLNASVFETFSLHVLIDLFD